MRHYTVEELPEVKADLRALNNSQLVQVEKAIKKVLQNPLPKTEGGLGNPLGNKGGFNLTGLCSIKLRKLGIRVIYDIVRINGVMRIIVVAARADGEVFRLAAKRTGRD
ncbi:MAG: type II toxin-antitoxin system RelE/ParE family toxin [Clostridiales bacterium]|jgi:mRNA interferase RelE/StbE|nr:type II toxin-antitoxin system RelE/ParE family toxin [Clostridiales bacterium]